MNILIKAVVITLIKDTRLFIYICTIFCCGERKCLLLSIPIYRPTNHSNSTDLAGKGLTMIIRLCYVNRDRGDHKFLRTTGKMNKNRVFPFILRWSIFEKNVTIRYIRMHTAYIISSSKKKRRGKCFCIFYDGKQQCILPPSDPSSLIIFFRLSPPPPPHSSVVYMLSFRLSLHAPLEKMSRSGWWIHSEIFFAESYF